MINLYIANDIINNYDIINRILEIVLSVIGTLFTGICVYAFKLAKRNGIVRELTNVLGEYIDTLILETKNEIAMWQERKPDNSYRYNLEPDIREMLLSKLKNRLEHLEKLSVRYHKQDREKI